MRRLQHSSWNEQSNSNPPIRNITENLQARTKLFGGQPMRRKSFMHTTLSPPQKHNRQRPEIAYRNQSFAEAENLRGLMIARQLSARLRLGAHMRSNTVCWD